jgi:hypothetical protein
MKFQVIFATPGIALLVRVFQALGPRSNWWAVLHEGQLSTTMTVTAPPLEASCKAAQAPQAKPFW